MWRPFGSGTRIESGRQMGSPASSVDSSRACRSRGSDGPLPVRLPPSTWATRKASTAVVSVALVAYALAILASPRRAASPALRGYTTGPVASFVPARTVKSMP